VRQERFVAEALQGKGIEVFLPTGKIRRQWSDRTKEVSAALFPGYLFSRINLENRLPVMMTPGVFQIVGNGQRPISVDAKDLKAIQRVIHSGLPNEPHPYLEVGNRVEIGSGPLTGLHGIVSGFRSRQRLIVSVSLLQRSVAVELQLATLMRSEQGGSRDRSVECKDEAAELAEAHGHLALPMCG
jgi:transcription antitermination factor NusG